MKDVPADPVAAALDEALRPSPMPKLLGLFALNATLFGALLAVVYVIAFGFRWVGW